MLTLRTLINMPLYNQIKIDAYCKSNHMEGFLNFFITVERIEALQHKECRLSANWAYTSEEILS